MAFPVGWKWKAAITIDKTKVPGDLTDYPFLICQANCPTDAMDSNGGKPAIDGGGDVRFSTDINGVTRLACDVQQFEIQDDPATAKVEVYVKVPAVSSSVNTIIYMWWGAVGETQPSRNAAYGIEATWDSNFKAVYHLTEGWTTTANAYKDATASAKTGTGSITTGSPTMTGPAGKWGGKCIRCSDAVASSKTYRIACGGSSPMDFNIRGSTISAWVQSEVDPQSGWFLSKGSDAAIDWDLRGMGMKDSTKKQWWNRSGGDTSVLSTNGISLSTWTKYDITVDGSGNLTFYKNGASNGTFSTIASTSGTNDFRIGSGCGDVSATVESWRGYIDEVRISNTARSSAHIGASYNNQNAPASFSSFGSTIRGNTHNDFFSFFS